VLEWWVVHCDLPPIQILVEAGADLDFVDEEGFSILQRAKRAGTRCDKVIEYLEAQLAAAGMGGVGSGSGDTQHAGQPESKEDL
jgi:hypothetical protein